MMTLPTEPKVACVILNWNGWRDTVACLKALERVRYSHLESFVVDNGSTDGSLEELRRVVPDKQLIANGKNLGFAGGNNVGILRALQGPADYVWLLNNDTEPTPDSLTELVKVARSNPRFGAIGSVMHYADNRHAVQAWGGGRVNRWSGACPLANSPRANRWFTYITAASMLVPRAAFEEVGLLDDGFFLYYEDVEFSCRLRRHGWNLAVAPAARIYHKENASTASNSITRDRYSTASGIRFLRAHSPVPWLAVTVFLSNRMGKRLLTCRLGRLLGVVRGIGDHLKIDRLYGRGKECATAPGVRLAPIAVSLERDSLERVEK